MTTASAGGPKYAACWGGSTCSGSTWTGPFKVEINGGSVRARVGGLVTRAARVRRSRGQEAKNIEEARPNSRREHLGFFWPHLASAVHVVGTYCLQASAVQVVGYVLLVALDAVEDHHPPRREHLSAV